MATISGLKELEVPGTPLFLFDCTLKSGDVERWSTHNVTVNGNSYLARVLKHNLFEIKSSPDATTDAVAKLSITLANADSFLSSIERNIGWKGAQLTVTFLFFDLINGVVASDSLIAFRGIANSPDQSTESSLRLSFTNRLNLQRVYLPEMSIQKRCPWTFPATAAQRLEAVNGGALGEFSAFYRCGYSADQTGGVGNLNSGAAYTTCDFTRTQCQQRGMFSRDNANNITRRFGGIEFVPASILVRTYGEKGSHVSIPLANQALYNDYVPLIYGTGWYQPPVVLARNDGNLTHFEVLLGAGQITGVVTVIVNNVEIPAGSAGRNMTATGWYNLISLGTRNGNFNPDFSDASGNPLGDPYGSMAFMSVVVPNNISNGNALPSIQVLVQGLQLATFDSSGHLVNEVFTNNPAWVLVDVLGRSGWGLDELDLASFAAAASVCNALVHTVDLNGNDTLIPRYQCNLILTNRRSAGDVVRGIRNACGLYLIFSAAGLLQLNVEDTLAAQQPTQAAGSNSTETLNGGWPAYEFGDSAFSGIARNSNGGASLVVSSRNAADSPNRYTVEFQDQFNQYQQDSLSLVDVNDARLFGQDVVVSLAALGLPNLDQAVRAAALQLYKSVDGNTYVDFQTSVKAVGLRPGDIITLTYSKEGFSRQPFRITEISPSVNYRTATITAQIHDDEWYAAANAGVAGLGRQPNFDIGVPRPLIGSALDTNGNPQFGITGSTIASSDGSVSVQLTVAFSVPDKPSVSSASIPLVGLDPQISTTGGTIAGAQTLYYAFSALDASGAESGLSFTVAANIPAATNTNQVTLISLGLSATATGFNVYRGVSPSQLLRIASNVAVAVQFVDSGATAMLKGPPDYNFDHANFYWRFELQPPDAVNIQSENTVGNSTLNMLPGDYNGAAVRITGGTGAGQERTVASYTATTITLTEKWDTVPDSSSLFAIAESTWQFGASSNASPVMFVVPNRDGTTIQVSGRAANALDNESDFDLSPVTRWTISGAAGTGQDTDVPGQPTFSLFPTGQGEVEVQAIGFSSLANTATISAGTLTLGFWDELDGLPILTLNVAVGTADTTLNLSTAVTAQVGDLVQIESEILVIQQTVTGAASCTVSRGAYGSSAATHVLHTLVYLLEKKTYIMPFASDFFGSLASGSYAYPVTIPDVRVATAELFVTNDRGNSSIGRECFTATTDVGIRTLSGGQLTIQVEGPLAIQTGAAPLLLMDTAHSVRDIYAVVKSAPTGTAITMHVTQNGTSYCQLTIPINTVISNDVDGYALGPLAEKAQIGLDITAVTETAGTSPEAISQLQFAFRHSMSETLEKLSPNRDLQCYFLEPSAIAALSGTSASGYTVSGSWRQQFDWAVIEWNRDNVFEHPAFRYLPDGDLGGLTLTYNETRQNCIPIDSTLFPTVDWPNLRVWGDPGTGEQLYKVPLLNYATAIAGSYVPATVQFTLSGTVTALDYVGLVFLSEHYPYLMNTGDTLEFAIQNIVAGVNAFSPTMKATQSGTTITLTYVGAGQTLVNSTTGANGNLIGAYSYVSNSMTEQWDAPSKQFSGGTSPSEWQIVLPFATLQDPTLGQIPASAIRKMRWTYSAAFQQGVFARSEFQVAVSNWAVTGTRRSYSVAGPGSRRIEDNSIAVQYSAAWTGGGGNFSGGTIQSTSTNSNSLTCSYTSAQTHSLYLGTRLADAGTLISVSVDGQTPSSVNLNVPTEDVLIRKLLGQFPAGTHTVVATHVGTTGTYFYFDFLEIAIPNATLPTESVETKLCFATDWDTEHSLALAPERTAWMIDSLGMHARVNHYVGALWFYELVNPANRFASGTVTFTGSPDPNLITELIIGRTDEPISTENTIQHLNLTGDTVETLALAFALELNRGYTAIRASVSGDQLTIYSRSLGADGNFITVGTSPNTTNLTIVVSSATLTGGVDGTWLTDLQAMPRLNRAARDWSLSFFEAVHNYGLDAVASFSMELGNGDTSVGAGIAQRYPSGAAVLLNTPSLQTNFSPTSADFWQQVHLDMANILVAAGLQPYLQFGEVQWWYKPDDGSGMPFYDAYTTSTFQAEFGRPITVITSNTLDPATIPQEAAFLPGLIGNFTSQIMAFVRATIPDCRFEVLYPIDVNDPPLNRVINYPVTEWTPAILNCLKTESFGYTLSRDLDLSATSIAAGIPLGFPASQRSHLVGISDSSTSWLKEARLAQGAGFESVVLFALDQFCLIGYSLPLSTGMRRSVQLG